jgi:ribosomal protein L24
MIKKNDKVRILYGNRAGVMAKVLRVYDTNNIKARVITDGPFKGEILEVVREGHYAKA